MPRDTRRNTKYFDKWINYREDVFRENKRELSALTIPSGISAAVYTLYDYSLRICVMKYSRGDKIDSFKVDIREAINMRRQMIDTINHLRTKENESSTMYTGLTLYTYTELFSILSFLYSLRANKADFKEVINLFDYLDKDTILNRVSELLTGYSDTTTAPTLLAYRKIYTPLLKVFDAKEEDRPKLMKKFIEGWYKSMKPAAWHDIDIKGYEGAYIGYWCFEAALVVNLLNIDDSSFRDNVYYPKDLIVRK